MTATQSTPTPVACVPGAIPEAQRKAHFALAERLFGELAIDRLPLTDGYRLRLPVAALGAVAQFLTNERRCCPFMYFVVAIAPGMDTITLTMTGPTGTREIIDAELNRHCGQPSGCGCQTS
jgi:hypothetical protein